MPLPPSLAGLTLTQLAYVVAVDEHRHFGRAAAACHVTQPTLSMQLGKLERLLGVALFDRGRAPVVPTEAGRVVAERARHVLREAARIAEAVASDGDAIAGELRLGVIPTVAPYLLPAAVHALARRHPGLALVVEERVTDDALAAVRAGALDAAVVATDAAGADLAETPLFTEPFLAYVGAEHRLAGRRAIAPGDLSLDDLWLLSEGHCLRVQTVRLCGERRAAGARGGAL
jgi:LysR family transcriptional regulator, hydrogen peroxide-inducible genes activator